MWNILLKTRACSGISGINPRVRDSWTTELDTLQMNSTYFKVQKSVLFVDNIINWLIILERFLNLNFVPKNDLLQVLFWMFL